MAYNETGSEDQRWRCDRGDRERSLGLEQDSSRWSRKPVHKRLGASYMLFSARAAEGVAGDKTLTPRASYSGLQEIVTPRLIEQLELIN